MKKYKITAVILSSLLLLSAFISAVSALNTDDFTAFGRYFGGNSTTQNDNSQSNGRTEARMSSSLGDILNGLLGGALDGLSSSQITEILNNFDLSKLIGGDSEALNEILDYIAAFRSKEPSSTTTKPSAPVTTTAPQVTVPQYTYIYVTEPQSQYSYTYVYVPQVTSPAVTTLPSEDTTLPEETTIIAYVPPQQVYTDILTTVPYAVFSPEIEEEEPENGVSVKMIAGIAILLISAVAVVGVSIALKKSRI